MKNTNKPKLLLHVCCAPCLTSVFEQLKDDFCYQNINGNFISVGASYDYSALGMTPNIAPPSHLKFVILKR